MTTYKIGIVGYGYVGKAMHAFFNSRYQHTIFYDPYITGSHSKEDINACDLAVVCVMTPQGVDGSCDTAIVEDTVAWLDCPLVLIKSTIAPGTTDALKAKHPTKRIVFSPEYIGESDYDTGRHDFNKSVIRTPFVTLGGDPDDTNAILEMLIPIMGPNKTYHQTTALTAELAKYMENSYLATKVVFAYEFERICKAFGAQYNQVRQCWLLDPRMESSHTAVFSTNTTPYSGKCLPKDLKAITVASKAKGYTPEFIEEVQKSNDRIGKLRAI